MDKLLEKLIKAFGVSGKEESIKAIIKEELEEIKKTNNINMDITEDLIGNIIVRIGEGKEKVMLCTHMDNAGVVVTLVEDNGFLRISPIGNLKPEKLVGNFIRFQNVTIGRVDASKANPGREDLFIDLGVDNKEVANKNVKEGDVGELITQGFISSNRIVASNLHSKIGCYSLLQVIKRIKEVGSLNKELYFVFSAQMEVGFRGARAAASEIVPNMALVLDSIGTEDYIGRNAALKLDKGPIISIFDKSLVIHQEVKEIIEGCAKDLNISIQYNIGEDRNEGGVIHKEVGGIKTGMIGIPCRYIYTSGEMMSLKDIDNVVDLISAVISR